MTDAQTQSYADRIAEAAAADGWPWRLTVGEAHAIAARYGVRVTLDGEAPHQLRQVAKLIAAEIV